MHALRCAGVTVGSRDDFERMNEARRCSAPRSVLTVCTVVRSANLPARTSSPALLALRIVSFRSGPVPADKQTNERNRTALHHILRVASYSVQVVSRERIRPVVDKVYTLAQLPEALAEMERGAHFGKICVTFSAAARL
jgi:NADPH:quinone reductase-like Zn-dependent oxidoreductase